MRENRPSSSEGGAGSNSLFLPLSICSNICCAISESILAPELAELL
jgi:hypothetical protein